MELLAAVGLILTGVGTFASVFGIFWFRATRYNGDATRALLRELIDRIDRRADERHAEMERAGAERHREALEMIAAVKGAR